MKISIMHISDLHRDLDNPISNSVLVNSLLQDITSTLDKDSSIPAPQIIIASGDIVQGVGRSDQDFAEKLKEQYEQAEEFLGLLSDKILHGNRENIVIVPGNHDINFFTAFSALKEIDYSIKSSEEKAKLANLIWKESSSFRWSWKDFKLYQINNKTVYEQRLNEFTDFYSKFYNHSRAYSNKPEQQFDIFDFPDLGITIVGFNSCFQNDPLNREGLIHPQAFANACNELRDRRFRGRLRLAVWHHSTKGTPRQDDYMDADFIQQLIAYEYSLGFHGHQHKSELLDEKFAFGGKRKINIISASTLAGGENSLSPGGVRGYNRIVLDTKSWEGKLYVREMQNSNFSNPIWGQGNLTRYNSPHDFSLQQPIKVEVSAFTSRDLADAEELLRNKRYEEARVILEPLVPHEDMALRLLSQVFLQTNNNEGIIKYFSTPLTSEEIILICNALWEEQKLDELRILLHRADISGHQDPAVKATYKKLISRLN